MDLGWTHPLTEMSNRNISLGAKAAVRRADNFAPILCRLPWNVGTSTFRNP